MAIGAVVLYPAAPDATFDMTYYLNHHKPLCVERWGKYGFKDINVLKVNAGADGGKPAYSVIATLTWDDGGKGDGISKALTGMFVFYFLLFWKSLFFYFFFNFALSSSRCRQIGGEIVGVSMLGSIQD
jgi:hypothetical protein